MVLLQNENLEVESEERKSHPSFLNGAHPNPPSKKDAVEAQAADLRGYWGQQVAFSTLVANGAIVKGGDGNYREGGGFTMGKISLAFKIQILNQVFIQ